MGFELSDIGDVIKDGVDDIGDAATSVVDILGDAGHEIGAVLKFIGPIVSLIPGYGTVIGAAIYAAGALCAKDRIDDIVIGTMATAIPAGIPRIGFNTAVHVTADVAAGRNATDSILNGCREVAAQGGGEKAAAAFDAGVAIARGDEVAPSTIAAIKESVASGNPAAGAAFDAGVAIAQHEGADRIIIGIGHDYIQSAGGSLAASAYDTGIALGYGKTLQEAGFTGLKTFVKGTGEEKVLNFVDAVSRAHNADDVIAAVGESGAVQEILTSDMANDLQTYLGDQLGGTLTSAGVDKALAPYINAIKTDPKYLAQAADQMVGYAEDEIVARAAQALMRFGNGVPDPILLRRLHPTVASIGKVSENRPDGTDAYAQNSAYAAQGQLIQSSDRNAALLREMPSWGVIKETDDEWRRGYDIGTAVSYGHTLAGPGQDAILASLHNLKKISGFRAARTYQYAKAVSAALPLDSPGAEARNNGLALQGQTLIANRPVLAMRRSTLSGDNTLRGFDIGVAVSDGLSQAGPGQDAIFNSLPRSDEQQGFMNARILQYSITNGYTDGPTLTNARKQALQALIQEGEDIIKANPVLEAARDATTNPRISDFLRGFDAAISTCSGNYLPGPGQTNVKHDLMLLAGYASPAAQAVAAGFELGQTIQLGYGAAAQKGVTISTDPYTALGQLAITGLSVSPSMPSEQKAIIMSDLLGGGNPRIRSGAASAIPSKGFIQSIIDFFSV